MWSKNTNKAEVAFQNALAEFFIALNETEGYDLDKCVETISQFAERGKGLKGRDRNERM